jgi:hypothetical protein
VCRKQNKQSQKGKQKMNLIQQKEELRSKISVLTAKTSLTSTERDQLSALIAQAADVRGQEERQARAASAMASVASAKQNEDSAAGSLELRDMLRGEARTYSPMSLGVEGSSIIAAQFADKLVQAQKAAGPFFCGSPYLSGIERDSTGE